MSMNPINPNPLNPTAAEELLIEKFLEFLQAFHEAEEKPLRPTSLFSQIIQNGLKGVFPLKISHQVQLLEIFQKTKVEVEEILGKAEVPKNSQPTEKERLQAIQKKVDPVFRSLKPETKTSATREHFAASGKILEKNPTLTPEKKEGQTNPSLKSAPAEKNEFKNVEFSSFLNSKEVENKNPALLFKQDVLRKAIQTLFTFLDPAKIERAPTLEIMQQIKPLLDHLIVVVETQQNMSHPSQKLVQLIRSLSETSSFFKHLAWSDLFKVEKSSADPMKAKTVSERSTIAEKTPAPISPVKGEKPSDPPSLFTPSSSKPAPFSSIRESELALPKETAADLAKVHPKEPTPWAAPYTAPKTGIQSRLKTKKKEKDFWKKRKEKEDEDSLNP